MTRRTLEQLKLNLCNWVNCWTIFVRQISLDGQLVVFPATAASLLRSITSDKCMKSFHARRNLEQIVVDRCLFPKISNHTWKIRLHSQSDSYPRWHISRILHDTKPEETWIENYKMKSIRIHPTHAHRTYIHIESAWAWVPFESSTLL